jgi:hypothetical protein
MLVTPSLVKFPLNLAWEILLPIADRDWTNSVQLHQNDASMKVEYQGAEIISLITHAHSLLGKEVF